MVVCLDVMNLHIEGDFFVIVSEPSLKAKVLSGLLIRWGGFIIMLETLLVLLY